MGLISRLRRGTTQRATPAPEAGAARPVLRAEDLRGPGWTQLPPPAPLLPPVPYVFSHRFQDQLVSWTPPARFVGALLHAVSPEAPSGIVEAIAILAPAPIDDAGDGGGGPDLVYAVVPGEHPGTDIETRIQNFTPRYRPVFPDAAYGTPEAGRPASPPPRAPGDTSQPDSGVGSARPAAEPHLLIARAERVANGRPDLRTAPVPATLPLVQLRPEPAETPEGPRAAEPGRTPRPGPEAPILSGRRANLDAPAAPTLDDAAPSSIAPLPLVARDAEASAPAPPSHLDPPVATPPLEPPAPPPVRRRQSGEALRRSGLGAPIAGLPATAAGFDPATLIKSSKGRARIAALSQTGGMPRGMGRALSGALGTASPGHAAARDSASAGTPAPGEDASWGDLPLVTFGAEHGSAVVPLEPLERPADTAGADEPPGVPPSGEQSAPLVLFAALTEPDLHPVGAAAAADTPGLEGSFVRTEIGMRHGVDLSEVPVDRSPAAATDARLMRARGYSSPAGIVIPPELGSLDSGPGAALLAHELTHVAQQVRLGAHAPDEATPAGRSLEVEALETEMQFAPATRSAAAPAARSVQPGGLPATRAAQSLPTFSGAGHAAPPPEVLPVAAPPRSAGVDRDTLASMLQDITTAAPAPFSPGLAGPSMPAAPPMATAAPVAAGIQRAAEEPSPSAAPVAAAAPPGSAAHDPDAGPFSKRPGDKELEKLAAWLYPLISFKIRTELRDGRERAGMLTDTYGRW